MCKFVGGTAPPKPLESFCFKVDNCEWTFCIKLLPNNNTIRFNLQERLAIPWFVEHPSIRPVVPPPREIKT